MDEILYVLCRHNVNIMDGWRPYPATIIAKQLNLSVNKVRYHLRKLKEQNIVETSYDGGMTEDGEVYCYHGWTITKDAHKTNEYQKAKELEDKLLKECFGI